jgi:hypothetical protein
MMNYDTRDFPVSPTFKYTKVLTDGKPVHGKYDSFSVKHPAMPLSKRAKIFSPFDALKGFDEAVASKDVLYEKKRELSEEDAQRLNQLLSVLRGLTINSRKARENHVQASVTYYVPCEDADSEAYKVMGTYVKKMGTVRSVDSDVYRIIQIDGYRIPIADIINIECKQAEETLSSPL